MKKYALITGASKGIGSAIAKTLAQDGYVVIIHYFRNKEKAILLQKEIEAAKGTAYLINGDLSNIEEIKSIFTELETITPVLDLLVNNAGVYFSYLIEDYPIDKVAYTLNVNFLSLFLSTQLALSFLKKSTSGHIINISSRLGKEKVLLKSSAYSASKAAVIQFTKSCALEFQQYSIRANAICPGFTNTDINQSVLKTEEDRKRIISGIPLNRIAEPQDIANVVSFLASDKASYINGEAIGVNGGSILT